MKTCTKCKEQKDYSCFSKHKKSKDGYDWWCKECCSLNYAKYYKKNKQKVLENSYKWKSKNKEKFNGYKNKWERKKRSEDPNYKMVKNTSRAIRRVVEKVNSMKGKKCGGCDEFKLWEEFSKDKNKKDGRQSQCKECIKKHSARRYAEKGEELRENTKKWKENNKERCREVDKEWKKNNREKVNGYKKNYRNRHPHIKLKQNVSRGIRKVVGNMREEGVLTKEHSALKYLGCSAEFFHDYIRSLYKEGMTDDNYGINGWHLDHIKPCAAFNFDNEEELYECFHYTNYQPMWAKENNKKNSWYKGKKHYYKK